MHITQISGEVNNDISDNAGLMENTQIINLPFMN